MLNVFFEEKKQTWIPNRIELAVEFLQLRSFFKRFSVAKLRQFITKMQIR